MNEQNVDDRVADAVTELSTAWPSCEVVTNEVVDERGVVAVLVSARADGRLIVATRAVELAPIDWGLTDESAIDRCLGLLPRSAAPTVAEVTAGLGVAW
jgi:hypothetical protein